MGIYPYNAGDKPLRQGPILGQHNQKANANGQTIFGKSQKGARDFWKKMTQLPSIKK